MFLLTQFNDLFIFSFRSIVRNWLWFFFFLNWVFQIYPYILDVFNSLPEWCREKLQQIYLVLCITFIIQHISISNVSRILWPPCITLYCPIYIFIPVLPLILPVWEHLDQSLEPSWTKNVLWRHRLPTHLLCWWCFLHVTVAITKPLLVFLPRSAVPCIVFSWSHSTLKTVVMMILDIF